MHGTEFKLICNKKNRSVIESPSLHIKYEDCTVLKFCFFFSTSKHLYLDFTIDCIHVYKFCFTITRCTSIFSLTYILYLEYLKAITNGYSKFECPLSSFKRDTFLLMQTSLSHLLCFCFHLVNQIYKNIILKIKYDVDKQLKLFKCC